MWGSVQLLHSTEMGELEVSGVEWLLVTSLTLLTGPRTNLHITCYNDYYYYSYIILILHLATVSMKPCIHRKINDRCIRYVLPFIKICSSASWVYINWLFFEKEIQQYYTVQPSIYVANINCCTNLLLDSTIICACMTWHIDYYFHATKV